MKHRVKVTVGVEKRGFFGRKKVPEERIIDIDGKIRKKMKREAKNLPYSIEEMVLYDEIFDEEDD